MSTRRKPNTTADRLEAMERRLAGVERSANLGNSSISQGDLSVRGGTITIANGGDLIIEGGDLTIYDSFGGVLFSGGPAGVFVNATLEVSGNNLTVDEGGNIIVNDAGSVQVNGGALNLNTGSMSLTGGTVNFDGAAVNINGSDFTVTSGDIILSGGALRSANYDDVAETGFSLSNTGLVIHEGSITGAALVDNSVSWAKSQGGTLALGGSSNALGNMHVLDADGIETLFELDQQEGGFGASRFYVGDFTSPTVARRATGGINIYVHGTAGNDNTGLGTEASPYESVSRAVQDIPDDLGGLDHTIYLRNAVTNPTGHIILGGRSNGTLRFVPYGTSNTPIMDGVTFHLLNNSGFTVYMNQFLMNAGTAEACVNVEGSGTFLWMNDCVIYGNNTISHGVRLADGAKGHLRLVDIYGTNYDAIHLWKNAQCVIDACTGLGDRYGVYNVASTMYGVTSQPGGTTSNIVTTWGGRSTTLTVNTGTSSPPPGPVKTSTWGGNWTRSWRTSFNHYRDDTRLIQGEWGGYGNHRGLVGFDDAAIRTALSGRTVDRVRIRMTRQASGGSSAGGALAFWTHNLSSQPASGSASAPALSNSNVPGVTWAWGQTKWAELPVSHGNALRDNTAKGIAIYSSSGTPYMPMNTSVILEITHS